MIKLVEISDKHRDSLVHLLNHEKVNRGLLRVPFPYTYEDADIFIKNSLSNRIDRNDFVFAIEKDGVHIGGIGLHKKFEHSAEVGYWLGEQYWGKGYATIALNKILELAINELKFSRIHAHVFEDNIASEKLLLRCGFEYEGLLKKCHVKKGIFINSKLFAKVV